MIKDIREDSYYCIVKEKDNIIVYDGKENRERPMLIAHQLYIKRVADEIKYATSYPNDIRTIESHIDYADNNFKQWAGKHFKKYALAAVHLALVEEIKYYAKKIYNETNRTPAENMED